jgi:hypothetical protein
MSQLTVVKSQIKDIEALRAAVETFGERLTAGGRARFYFGQSDACDYVVKMSKGKYDLGFKREASGDCYEIVADSEILAKQSSYLATDMHATFGPGLKNLYQEYTYQKLAREQSLLGRMVSKETMTDGRLRLRVTGY